MCTSICKLQEHERNVELDKEASRTNTLNPSASFYVRPNSGSGHDAGTGRREGGRPSYMPMRSASMRETSYRYVHCTYTYLHNMLILLYNVDEKKCTKNFVKLLFTKKITLFKKSNFTRLEIFKCNLNFFHF